MTRRCPRGLRVTPARLLLVAISIGAWSPPARAGELELSLGAGFYRLSATQDLGDYAQLGNLRAGVLDTSLAALDLRGAYCVRRRLCLGALVGAMPGALAGRAALALAYRGELSFHLLTGTVMPFVALSAGGLTLISPASVLGRDTDPTGAWSAGFKVRIAARYRLRVDFTHLLTDAQSGVTLAHNFALTAGVAWVLPVGAPPPAPPSFDADGDGLIDARDRCPRQAEDPDGFADDDGCPDPDNDGDGVVDHLDFCPRRAGAAPRGCPRGAGAGEAEGAR